MDFTQQDVWNENRDSFFPGAAALAHDHEYLRSLRGELQDVHVSNGRSSLQSANQEALTENDPLSEIEITLQALLHDWHKDWSSVREDEILKFPSDQDTGNPSDYNLQLCCSSCLLFIDRTQGYFFCKICKYDGDIFDLCESCATSGKRCRHSDHELRRVKSTQVAFNLLVRVPARAIHSLPKDRKHGLLPSIDELARPDMSLSAVLQAYHRHPLKTSEPNCQSGLKKNLDVHFFKDERERSVFSETLAVQYVHQWRNICHFLAHDHYEPSIHRFLTQEHIDVVKLLLEWWIGDIQDFRLSQMGLIGLLIATLFPATHPRDQETLSASTRSEYHRTLCELFLLEFDSLPPDASILHRQRAEASRHASVQRLGFSKVRGSMVPLWHKHTESMYDTALKFLDSALRVMRPGLRLCAKENAVETHRFAVELLTAYHDSIDMALANLRSAQQILGPRQLNASISPCPWISETDKLANVPHYLWDKTLRQTVSTRTLAYFPEYTIVSHTWGRWRIRGSEDVVLPGVPWKIPQNERFSVHTLADTLNGVPGDTRYVWFDLVCIPQSTNDVKLKAIEKQEIAKQAAIFSHADTAIAWFNSMDDFGPLEEICHMLAMNALKYPGPFDDDQIHECLERLSSINANLTKEPLFTPLAQVKIKKTQDTPRWDLVLDEWFSSLWTLQEACMRPDMWLCTRNWKPLESRGSGIPIPLDCVLSLIRCNAERFLGAMEQASGLEISRSDAAESLLFHDHESRKAVALIERPPQCLLNFVLYVSTAALIDIPGIEPIRIITMGNQRECKRNRRAEAIMAVLDVKDWYQDISPGQPVQLVLERFPLTFVNEVRRKLGDYVFFSSDIARDFWTKLDEAMISLQHVKDMKLKGTMLPFSEDRSRDVVRLSFKNMPLTRRTLQSLGESEKWQIEANGNVVMHKASVLMSSDSYHSDLPQFYVVDLHDIARRSQGLTLSLQEMVGMKEWISKRPYKCYAVALQRANSSVKKICCFSGVILREIEPHVLIKSGRFTTCWVPAEDYEWSTAKEVNWRVL